jgi:hypothetical protein
MRTPNARTYVGRIAGDEREAALEREHASVRRKRRNAWGAQTKDGVEERQG